MSQPEEAVADDLMTKTQVSREFGLTEKQVKLLGEPDVVKPNPHYRKAGAPMRLYSCTRVQQWVEDNQPLLSGEEWRREAAFKGVETKREKTREQVAELVRGLRMDPAPSRRRLEHEAGLFILKRYGHCPDKVSEKALCSHLRHDYTNYEVILADVKGRVGMGEFYFAVKAYLCCRIVEHYRLKVDPLIAAFGRYDEIPEWLLDCDPEVAARRVLGIEADAVSPHPGVE
jgi:hypothetical protein